MRGNETIRVVRKPKADRLKPALGPPEEFDVKGCIVLPRASNEQGQGWVQISGFTVYAPPDADILADDQAWCRGSLHSVDGVPGLLANGHGKGKKLAVTLERVS